MTLHRFFVDAGCAGPERVRLPDPVARQVRNVLRLRDGDRIVLLTGDGREAVCRLSGGDGMVEAWRAVLGEPVHRLGVVQALLKGTGLEEVVQRGTEVGVAEFHLAVTDRCVARELSDRKLERLRTIARESAEQSERGLVPPVHAPQPLRGLVGPGTVLLFERAAVQGGLAELDPPATIAVGPEGGFTSEEVDRARAAGAAIVGLGRRILRSPTVAPVAAALVLSRTGDFA